MEPEGLVWETPFQVSGTFFMSNTQHWGLGENENLFLRRDTPSTQKVVLNTGEPRVFRSNQNRSRS